MMKRKISPSHANGSVSRAFVRRHPTRGGSHAVGIESEKVSSKVGAALDTKTNNCGADQKRADTLAWHKRKSRAIAGGLAAVCEPENERALKAYRRCYYQCTHTIHQRGGVVSASRTCGTRGCMKCGYSRSAKWVRENGDYVESWAGTFLTLTWPNCPPERGAIRESLAEAQRAWRAVGDRVRRMYGPKAFRAVRKLEATYNGPRGVNLHMHLVIDDLEIAWTILHAWVDVMPGADRAAQDLRPADGGALAELLKYVVKDAVDGRLMPPAVRHEILEGMHKKRMLQACGWTKADAARWREEHGEPEAELMLEANEGWQAWKRATEDLNWQWEDGPAGWIDRGTGEMLAQADMTDTRKAMIGGGLPKAKDPV